MSDVVLVTGAKGGIGREVARQLATSGATVLLTARDGTDAEAAVGGIEGEVSAAELDVTSPESVEAVARLLEDRHGRLDVLINNAAGFVDWTEQASSADLEAARRPFDVNLFGTWRLTQALLPLLLRSDQPRVVNVSSGAGSHEDAAFGLTTGGGAVASYGISKAAVNALTSKLAAELEGQVQVNAVCPGLTATAPGMEEMGARPVEEGAAGVLWAVRLPADGPTGGFFRDGEPLGW